MILKALYDYYDRRGNFPSLGMELRQIALVIEIDSDGNFVDIWDTRCDDPNGGKKKIARTFCVAKDVGRSSNITPNLFYDNPKYVLGVGDDDRKCHDTFVNKCSELHVLYPNNSAFSAVVAFYNEKNGIDKVKTHSLWGDMQKQTDNIISFMLQGSQTLVSEDDDIISYARKLAADSEDGNSVCLVTGNRCEPVRVTTKLLLSGQKNRGSLVSFNNISFWSYGKEQCFNAPISPAAEAKYSAALKAMLEKGSSNRYYVGDRTMLFWASSANETALKAEQGLFSLFNFSSGSEDNPDRNVELVKQLFRNIYSGETPVPAEDKFYFLGLAPNNARIAVVYWQEMALKDFAEKINRHFEDMSLGGEGERYAGVYQMLLSIAPKDKSNEERIKKLPKKLVEEIIRSVVEGTPYPNTFFSACLRRIRADHEFPDKKPDKKDVKYPRKREEWKGRIAIIKAYLRRIEDNNIKPDIMLDKENNNQGYLCGRLFAVLDSIQEKARAGKTLREGYLTSASATPSVVFPKLLNLSVHHSAKLDAGMQIWYEKLKTEICSKIPSEGFPATLSIQDQGRFMIGYYHQREDLFTKKDNKDN